MMIGTMSAMMERMGPSSVHVLSTRAPRGTPRKLARKVYRQMRRDFFVASPFVLHASVPELLAGAWSVVRETLFTGEVDRGRKEIVASAVSVANQCPFCVGAHTAAVKAAKVQEDTLQVWAEASGSASNPALRDQPFEPSERAEFLGTIVAFHYLNRMVSAFLDEKLMPTPSFMDGMANYMAKIMMGGMIRKGRRNTPGASESVRPEYDASLGWRPEWAASAPHIADALEAWSALNEEAAREHLGADFVKIMGATLDAWNGGEVGLGYAWLDERRPNVPTSHVAAADLALLTAMAPWAVTDDRLEGAIDAGMSKEQVLVTVAWAAYRAARRVGTWVHDAASPTDVAAEPVDPPVAQTPA